MPITLRQLRPGTVLLICALFATPAAWAVEPEPEPEPGRRSKFAVPEPKRAQAKRFRLELQIANGHIGSVFIGCQKGATDAYDNGLDDLDAFDQATLISERDKTLFTQGLRLIDQRRFGLDFTYVIPQTDGTVAPLPGAWRYLPLTQSERNANTNL